MDAFMINIEGSQQSDPHLTDDTLKCIFLKDHFVFQFQFHLRLVPGDPVDLSISSFQEI